MHFLIPSAILILHSLQAYSYKPPPNKDLSHLLRKKTEAINLKGNDGSHILRKTFGYHQRKTFGRGIPELMVVFNHSTQRQTLDYLCIQPDEIKDIYLNEL
jgi:hypothetical protein